MNIGWRDVIDAVIGLLAGIGITVSYYSVRKTKFDSAEIKQTGNVVGGDQAGRDIKK